MRFSTFNRYVVIAYLTNLTKDYIFAIDVNAFSLGLFIFIKPRVKKLDQSYFKVSSVTVFYSNVHPTLINYIDEAVVVPMSQ